MEIEFVKGKLVCMLQPMVNNLSSFRKKESARNVTISKCQKFNKMTKEVLQLSVHIQYVNKKRDKESYLTVGVRLALITNILP